MTAANLLNGAQAVAKTGLQLLQKLFIRQGIQALCFGWLRASKSRTQRLSARGSKAMGPSSVKRSKAKPWCGRAVLILLIKAV